MEFAFVEYYLSVMLLVTAMIGMGATLSPREFLDVIKAPQGVLTVLVCQIVVTPLVAIGLASLLRLPEGIAFGLLLISTLPGGLFSNLLTYLGRGNVALSIAATGVSTLLCLVSTSALLRIHGTTHLPDGFVMPVARIILEISCFLLAPLLIGMTVRRVWPGSSPLISRIFLRISTCCLLVFVVGALLSGRLQVATYGWRAPLALFLFGAASMWVAIGVSCLFRLTPSDRFTVAIEVVVRNGNLGLLLKAAIFPAVAGVPDPVGDGVLFTILFYAGLCLALALWEVMAKRMKWTSLYSDPKRENAGE